MWKKVENLGKLLAGDVGGGGTLLAAMDLERRRGRSRTDTLYVQKVRKKKAQLKLITK